MGLSILSRISIAILSILRVGLSIAIIIITAQQLYHIDIVFTHNSDFVAYSAQCLLTGDVRGRSVCEYTYAVCGLSLLLSCLTSILLCITCDMCGAGSWLETIVEGFQTAWWVVAGIVISKKVRDSNEATLGNGASLPKEDWRNAVAVMTWVAALLSFLAALIYLATVVHALAKCCGCCGGKNDDDSSHDGHQHLKKDKKDGARRVDYGEQPQQPQPPVPQAGMAAGRDSAVRANAV